MVKLNFLHFRYFFLNIFVIKFNKLIYEKQKQLQCLIINLKRSCFLKVPYTFLLTKNNKTLHSYVDFYLISFTKYLTTFSYLVLFQNIFNISNFHAYNIKKKKLEIVGYHRRSWLRKKKNKLVLKLILGYSYLEKFYVPQTIRFILRKRRICSLKSMQHSQFQNIINKLIALNPSSSYKRTGIVPFKINLKLKKRRVTTY
jgi:hypothetical protein